MTRLIGSSEKQQIQVRLTHRERGELGKGVLHFGGNQLPQVFFDIWSTPHISSGEKFDFIEAISDGGMVYTLCLSKAHAHSLYAEYLIESKVIQPEFEQISVRYSEASEWFLHCRKVTGQVGEQLTWKEIPKPISVVVSTKEDNFALCSEYMTSRNLAGEELTIHEHIEFVFTAKESKFSVDDVKSKTHELSCLLSILMGCPASIVSVKVRAKNDVPALIHFPCFTTPERETSANKSWTRWFIQAPKVEDRWQKIFAGYYASPYRKLCWQRLAAMQRYDGFWEYNALGYITVLDKFVSLCSERGAQPSSKPITNKKLTQFRHRVETSLPHMSVDDAETIHRIASEFLKSNRHKSFGEKFHETIDKVDQDIQEIISISRNDFQFIKQVRDAIAHGLDLSLLYEDFPRADNIVAKIALLLTYWAFNDLGLTKDDFIDCLYFTHNSLRRSCVLDEVMLDRASGKASFFSLSATNFEELLKNSVRHAACFVRAPNDDLCFSEKYTQIYAAWLNNPSRVGNASEPKEVLGVNDNQAKYYAKSYLEFEDKRIKISGMWIVDLN